MTLTPLKLTSNTRFFTNFRLSLKSNKKMLVFISVLSVLGLPLLATVLVASAAEEGDVGLSAAAFAMISVFCIFAAVLCGIIIAVTNFSYLYKKSQVDMVYSLPIKKKYKFLSDFISGLAVYIVPYIIGCILCNLILLGGEICITELKDLLKDGTFMSLVLQGEFAGLLMMIMLYTLSILVICCCGTLFESIMNIFMINALIPGAIAVIAAMFFADLYGVPIFETIVPMLGYTSPIGAVIYMFYVIEGQEYFYTSDFFCINAATYGKWVLMFILFTAIYFGLTMLLYNKRKAEDVSKPYVFKLLYYILITVITMAISLIARYEFSMAFPVVIFSLIVYMIFEVITNRGFKKIYKSFIRFGITMAGILIFCVAAIGTHGFGVEGRTYSPSRISSVEVSYSGIDNIMNDAYFYDEYFYDEYWFYGFSYDLTGDEIEYKDEKVIETVVDIQKQAIETYKNGNYSTYSDFENNFYGANLVEDMEDEELYNIPTYKITFKFHLKTGGTMTRNYVLTFEQAKQLFLLESAEEFVDYKAKELKNIIKQINIVNGKSVIEYNLNYSLLKNEYSNLTSIQLTKDETDNLIECYKLDYMEATTDEFMTSRPLCYIEGYIPIRECFERTVDFIRNHGGLESSSYYPSNLNYIEGTLYSPEGYKSWGRDDITATFGRIKLMESLSHKLTNSQTQELLKIASSFYYAEEDCYVMEINDCYYAIPAKYSDIAEKIYKSSKANDNRYDFDEFIQDLRSVNNSDAYIDNYLDGDYYWLYEDIEKAFSMRYIDSEVNINDQSNNEIINDYNLLKKYFNFTSLEEYTMYMEENGKEYNKEEIEREWEEYCTAFPRLSERGITK